MAESGRSRAWIVEKFGGPERLTLSERDDPSPGRGEVRLRTAAIGLNFADLFVRAGAYPNTPPAPMVPGMEVVTWPGTWALGRRLPCTTGSRPFSPAMISSRVSTMISSGLPSTET